MVRAFPRMSARDLQLALAIIGLGSGLVVMALGATAWPARLWIAGTLPVLMGLLWEIVTSLRRGEIGLDIVAALSMTAALAFGEHLAAAVVALMYASGQYFESFAEARAQR